MSGGQTPSAKSHVLRNAVIVSIVILGALAAVIFMSELVFFNCCGGFTNFSIVQVTSSSCTGTTGITCSVKLLNSGSADTSVVSGSLTVNGQSASGTCQRLKLDAGSTTTVACTFPITPGVPGQQFTGVIGTSDGASVRFEGTFGQ